MCWGRQTFMAVLLASVTGLGGEGLLRGWIGFVLNELLVLQFSACVFVE